MYLTKDIIGGASGVQYFKRGEKVIVLNTQYSMKLVRSVETGVKYHVWPENLSEKPPVPDENENTPTDIKKCSGHVQQVDKRKGQRKGVHKLRSGGNTGGELF
jgi:hypothetical protein